MMKLPASSVAVLAMVAMPIITTTVEAAQRFAAFPNDALIPRYLVDKSFPLARRGSCGEGHHPCQETGHSDQCCDNESYCYIDSDGDPRCCPIGSNCPLDSKCKSDHFFCTTTLTESGTAVSTEGCCTRRCISTSQYLCAPDDGGGCCNYTAECRNGGCIFSSDSSSTTALVKPVEEGCTTSQYRCPDGKGCCDNDQSCTEVTGTAFCASGSPTETGLDHIGGEDDDDDGGDDKGLSDGAKAGIGVGAVVGAAAIIGALTWLCIYKRRSRRRATTAQPSGTASDGRAQEDAATVTEVSQTTSRPPQPGQGLTQDYFGPDPVAGPYTVTPGQHTVAGSASPGLDRAVPGRPEQPGDIAAPVEMGSETVSDRGAGSPIPTPSYHGSPHMQEPVTIEGRFELYGSDDAEPPPRSPSIMPTPAAYRARKEDEW
ncbi:hypothetical protein ACO1O0_002063 [Amphichorda felina]